MNTTRPSNTSECERCDGLVPRTVAHHRYGGRVCLPCLAQLEAHLCHECEDESEEMVNAEHLCVECAPPAPAADGDVNQFMVGEQVWWDDPDCGVSSGGYTVVEIHLEHVVISNAEGSVAEVPYHEIRAFNEPEVAPPVACTAPAAAAPPVASPVPAAAAPPAEGGWWLHVAQVVVQRGQLREPVQPVHARREVRLPLKWGATYGVPPIHQAWIDGRWHSYDVATCQVSVVVVKDQAAQLQATPDAYLTTPNTHGAVQVIYKSGPVAQGTHDEMLSHLVRAFPSVPPTVYRDGRFHPCALVPALQASGKPDVDRVLALIPDQFTDKEW